MAEHVPRVYTKEEVERLCPAYKGRPENFNPNRTKKVATAAKPKGGPASPKVTPPTQQHRNVNPTPQRNEPLYAEAIFGTDISVVELAPLQSITPNLSKTVDVADSAYAEWATDDQMLARKMTQYEFRYYVTSLTWLRIIDLKAKFSRTALTSAEKDIRKATEHMTFNVPAPVHVYLSSLGAVNDKAGKRTEVLFPNLPTAVRGGKGGYHTAAVDVNSHNLYEEIPTLGIMGDVLMALATGGQNPPVNVPLDIPANSSLNENCLGYVTTPGQQRPEISQNLRRFGITDAAFAEFQAGTRFNLRLLSAQSALIGDMDTFKVEKVLFANLSADGTLAVAIQSKPDLTVDGTLTWRQRTVQTMSPEASSAALMGAGNFCGFQLRKEDGTGANASEERSRWCCLSSTDHAAWPIPNAWSNNRNDRRQMPSGIGTERFGTAGVRQDVLLDSISRRLVLTKR